VSQLVCYPKLLKTAEGRSVVGTGRAGTVCEIESPQSQTSNICEPGHDRRGKLSDLGFRWPENDALALKLSRDPQVHRRVSTPRAPGVETALEFTCTP
jgi:hypothetical protein